MVSLHALETTMPAASSSILVGGPVAFPACPRVACLPAWRPAGVWKLVEEEGIRVWGDPRHAITSASVVVVVVVVVVEVDIKL